MTIAEKCKRELKRRRALHCVYGLKRKNAEFIAQDETKARYFYSDKAFEKFAEMFRDCYILAIHKR